MLSKQGKGCYKCSVWKKSEVCLIWTKIRAFSYYSFGCRINSLQFLYVLAFSLVSSTDSFCVTLMSVYYKEKEAWCDMVIFAWLSSDQIFWCYYFFVGNICSYSLISYSIWQKVTLLRHGHPSCELTSSVQIRLKNTIKMNRQILCLFDKYVH